jgi:hypothetical protein
VPYVQNNPAVQLRCVEGIFVILPLKMNIC